MSAEPAASAKKSTEKPVPSRNAISWLGRALAAIALGLLAITAFGNLLWKQAGAQLAYDPRYRLTAESLELSESAAWIHHDLRPEIFAYIEDGKPVSILDEGLTETVFQAATAHPWIAEVHEIRKNFPARLRIVCEYRKSVAMVRVREGLLPVDVHGILLPTRDFTPQEAAQYPRIEGIDTVPSNVAGQPWGDPRVEAAAKLAEILAPYWSSMRLARIVPSTTETAQGSQIPLEVETLGGSRVIWGTAPGVRDSNEASTETKLRQLNLYFKDHGSLEDISGAKLFDLRPAAGPRITPLSPEAH